MEKAAQRNAAREARLGAPGQPRSGLRNDATPSPSASEGSAALPFQIPLLPAPKAGRSLSHSQGQREYPPVSGAHSTQADHAPALPLGLLAEEVDTESESDLGGGLTHTTSHPPIGTLHRTATYPATYDAYYSATNGKEHGESVVGAQGGSQEHRRLDTAFSHLSLGKFTRDCLKSSLPRFNFFPLTPPRHSIRTSTTQSVADTSRLGRRPQHQRIASPFFGRHSNTTRLLRGRDRALV